MKEKKKEDTKMKDKGTIWAVLCALSLGWFACDDEVMPVTDGKRPLAEGEYVVDYATDGLDTRSIHAGVPKNVRISSLTYLLYDANGSLVKRREIPDIDTNTVWPLRRETMTWAQREALKDTLDTRRDNAVAFVANIDPEKCGWRDAAGELWSPLQNPDDYNNAYLELPSQPFEDSNMFYIFTRDTLLMNGIEVDRDHPLNCPVMLHRVVTRTDFFREQLPAWEEIDNPEAALPQPGDTVYQYLAYYAKNIYTENLNPKEEKDRTTLVNSLIEEQKEFLQEIYDYFMEQSVKFTAISDWVKVDKYVKLYTNINDIQTYLDKQKETAQPYLTTEARMDTIFKSMMNDCLANPALRERWKASWCKGKEAQLVYKETTGVNQFQLKKHTTKNGITESARIPVDTSIVVTDPIYNFNVLYSGFSHIGFADPTANILSKICWYDEMEENTTNELSATDLTTGQDGNEWYEVRYHPMLPLSYKAVESATPKSYVSVYDLNNLPFKDALRTDKITEEELDKLVENLKKVINEEALPAFSEEDKTKYFEGEPSLANVRLTVHYPDLSKDGVLVFNEKWDIRKVQGRR